MPFWKRDKPAANDAGEETASGRPDAPAAASSAPPPAQGGPGPAAPGSPHGGAPASQAPTAGSGSAPQEPPAGGSPIEATMLEAKVVEVIRTCYDPEIPVNIYELGLIYEVDVRTGGEVHVKMTLTSPMCPVAGTLPHEVEAKVASVAGVTSAHVDVVWDPPWTPEKMSEAAKLQLGML